MDRKYIKRYLNELLVDLENPHNSPEWFARALVRLAKVADLEEMHSEAQRLFTQHMIDDIEDVEFEDKTK